MGSMDKGGGASWWTAGKRYRRGRDVLSLHCELQPACELCEHRTCPVELGVVMRGAGQLWLLVSRPVRGLG